MRIVFVGTSSFGIPILEKLINLKKNIVTVITQPDRHGGRGKKILYSPVKRFVLQESLQVFQPEDINSDIAVKEIAKMNPDLIILVAYGQILTSKILQLPKYGCLNIHPSLLPNIEALPLLIGLSLKEKRRQGLHLYLWMKKIDTSDYFPKSIEILQKKILIN